jgi:hypothetical protein
VSLPFLIEGFELSTTATHQAPRRLCSGEEDDLRAFQFCQARLAAGAGTVAETIYPFDVEPVEALADGLGMTAKFLGDPDGA